MQLFVMFVMFLRDVLNEMPTEEERSLGQELSSHKSMGSEAVLRTNLGDITIKLFTEECPKTIENFAVR